MVTQNTIYQYNLTYMTIPSILKTDEKIYTSKRRQTDKSHKSFTLTFPSNGGLFCWPFNKRGKKNHLQSIRSDPTKNRLFKLGLFDGW